MEELKSNNSLIPEFINANVNLDLKAEGWPAVAIVLSVCTSVIAIYYINNKQ